MKARAAAAKRVRTPNCTHINMDRLYSREQVCFVCGHAPSLGFLYVCRQDHHPDRPAPAPLESNADENAEDLADLKSQLRRELKKTGLSESVILTAEEGGYTPDQLEKLKSLKLELKNKIELAVQAQAANGLRARLAFGRGPWNNDGASNSSSRDTNCNFQACHTCRPYYKDRVYISLQAVIDNEFEPVTLSDAAILPTKEASKLQSIGLHLNPMMPPVNETTSSSMLPPSIARSRASIATFKTTQTDMDDLAFMRRPRRRFYNLGHRSSFDIAKDLTNLPLFTKQGLKSAIQGIFRPSRESSSSGSNITLPLPRTGTARDLSEGDAVREFDIGTLRRVRRQKERNDLRNGTCLVGFEGVKRQKMSATTTEAATPHVEASAEEEEEVSDSEFTVYSCASEGSEVEVDGGVALTEEAVETHTPDILSFLSEKAFSLEIAEEADDSIMVQV